MDKSQEILSSTCPVCGRGREYKTRQGYLKGLTKPCKSCSNSINAGGSGWTGKCIDCGEEKDYLGSASLCKACHNKRTLAYHKETYRFNRYGVTKCWYLEEAKKGCAICHKPIHPESDIKEERGHIDHNHVTGKVRGVLCGLCNKGLGQFKDSVLLLEAAVKYMNERG
jgi:uncharacterized protein (DUF983 family)